MLILFADTLFRFNVFFGSSYNLSISLTLLSESDSGLVKNYRNFIKFWLTEVIHIENIYSLLVVQLFE